MLITNRIDKQSNSIFVVVYPQPAGKYFPHVRSSSVFFFLYIFGVCVCVFFYRVGLFYCPFVLLHLWLWEHVELRIILKGINEHKLFTSNGNDQKNQQKSLIFTFFWFFSEWNQTFFFDQSHFRYERIVWMEYTDFFSCYINYQYWYGGARAVSNVNYILLHDGIGIIASMHAELKTLANPSIELITIFVIFFWGKESILIPRRN